MRIEKLLRHRVFSARLIAVNLPIVVALMLPASATCAAEASFTYPNYYVIYAFKGTPDGSLPVAGLVADPQGRFYGTTEFGGIANEGTVFRLSPPASGQGPWSEEVLHSFSGPDGANPVGPVLLGTDGAIYGTTLNGGASNRGAVFKLGNLPGSPLTLLHEFHLDEGGNPSDGVVFGPDGLIYGTTSSIDQRSYADTGTDFSLSPLGDKVEYKVLHTFGKLGDGIGPVGLADVPSSLGSGLVGATKGDNDNDKLVEYGILYTLSVQANGSASEMILHNFEFNGIDVYQPVSPPIVGQFGIKNSVFGCAAEGGSNSSGGIYRYGPDGRGSLFESVIFPFGVDSGGAVVEAACSVIQGDLKGDLFGTTDSGGESQGGTVFEVEPATGGLQWSGGILINFQLNSIDGWAPSGSLLRAGSTFYGTLSKSADGNGSVYVLPPVPRQ